MITEAMIAEHERVIAETLFKGAFHGYIPCDYECLGIIEITIDPELYSITKMIDEEAVVYAIEDGIPIIPVDELPEGFDRRYLGWLDTPVNRARIQEVTDKLNQYNGLEETSPLSI